MKRIIDQTILLVYCMAVGWQVLVDTSFVIAFLAAVIHASVCDYTASGRWSLAATLVYLFAAVFKPQFLLFSPLVLYSVFAYQQYFLAAASEILCLYHYFPENPKVLCLLVAGHAVACLVQYRTEGSQYLENKLRKIRDDDTELQIVLEEKNRTLRKKQDYEIYAATLKERNRIAREIHDNVGHMLSRSILMVGAMKAIQKEDALSETLKQLEDTLNTAMDNVRESVHDLHDESVNLKETLEALTGEFTFCPATLIYDMGYDVPREIKYSFIAIIKEALSNVMKHSDATVVRITAREHPGLYQLIVADDGKRIDSRRIERRKELSDGIGLKNIEDRTKSLGGNLQVQTKEGFCIYVTVPKAER